MKTVSLEEAQSRLPEFIDSLRPDEHLTILKGEVPIADMTPVAKPITRSGFGCCRDMVISYVEDDEHLKDFEEYM